MNKQTVYIALDFDGVLHHAYIGAGNDDYIHEPENDPDIENTVDQYISKINARNAADEFKFFNQEGVLFDKEHYLIELLKQVPEARIVLSTSWHDLMTCKHLIQCLRPETRQKVVGVLRRDSWERYDDGVREKLMCEWLQKNSTQTEPVWIALDDQPRHYQSMDEHVVWTSYFGMDEESVAIALNKIAALKEQACIAVGLSNSDVAKDSTSRDLTVYA